MFGKIKEMMSAGTSSTAAKAAVGTVGFGLTSTGSTQVTAYELKHGVNVFVNVAANTGAILNSNMEVGESVCVINGTGTALNLYPSADADIDGAATNAAIVIAGSGRAIVVKVASDAFASIVGA